MSFNNNLEPNMYSPILYERRTGGFIDKTEQLMIRDGRVLLSELPSQFERVTIEGGDIELWVESENEIVPVIENPTPGVPKTAYYTVNYSQGFVYFDHSFNGKTLVFKYKGTGAAYFPASRIYTKANGLDVAETMEDMLLIADDTLKLAERFKYVGEYDESATYFHRNIVRYGNALYMCTVRNFEGIVDKIPTNEDYWQMISRGFHFTGIFNLDTVYMNGDMVMTASHEEIYICLQDKVSQKQPSEDAYWLKVLSIKEIVAVLQSKIDEYENSLKPDIVAKTNLAQEKADLAQEKADYAKEQGDYAKEQGQFANDKGIYANEKAEFANTKAELADQKAHFAQEKASYANEQGDYAKAQGEFANEKAGLADQKATLANEKADLANTKAELANEKANLAQSKSELAEEKAGLADQKATLAQDKADYAKEQGDYAKEQGDHAKTAKENVDPIIENFKHIGEHDTSVDYKKFNIVSKNGSSYMAAQDNVGQNVTDTIYWRLIGSIGHDGGNLIYRGTYDNATTYRLNDLVKKDNAVYSCLQECTGITPPNNTYWNLFISGGGDMSTDVYDTDNDGIIDKAKLSESATMAEDSKKLGGKLPDEYCTSSDFDLFISNNEKFIIAFQKALTRSFQMIGKEYDENSLETTIPELMTTNKDSLIHAINELSSKSVDMNEFFKIGVGSFVGNNNETTIPHGSSKVPKFVDIKPSQKPNGYLGEVWVRFDGTNIYVGNSGSFTGTFNYLIYF